METSSHARQRNRMGFHYYPDSDHYREDDLFLWLPRLQALGAGWLTLQAPANRAVPEPFIRGLVQAGVQPVLHFPCPQMRSPDPDTLQLLLSAYADWGVQYVVLFDRPNLRRAWPKNRWAQQDLVERFLDLYLPPANLVVQAGMIPVFPPLEPGGDYWDTAFLRAALKALLRRAEPGLVQNLALGAYAWSGERPLAWGAGGPERWPGARPYFTPANQQDQRGFYIFDWYRALSQAALGRALPMLLFGAGSGGPQPNAAPQPVARQLAQAQLLFQPIGAAGEVFETAAGPLETVTSEVIAAHFWLLCAHPDHPAATQAWYPHAAEPLPIVTALPGWLAEPGGLAPASESSPAHPMPVPPASRIPHYLLLPGPEQGLSGWLLEAAQPYILRHQPTVGFSLEEARAARQVTVVGGASAFPEAELENLRAAGCLVTRLSGDGTSIATQLATQ